MSAVDPKQLALLKARLNAARLSAMETHKSMTSGKDAEDLSILPFLDTCAQELEETARMIRAAADAAATPSARHEC